MSETKSSVGPLSVQSEYVPSNLGLPKGSIAAVTAAYKANHLEFDELCNATACYDPKFSEVDGFAYPGEASEDENPYEPDKEAKEEDHEEAAPGSPPAFQVERETESTSADMEERALQEDSGTGSEINYNPFSEMGEEERKPDFSQAEMGLLCQGRRYLYQTPPLDDDSLTEVCDVLGDFLCFSHIYYEDVTQEGSDRGTFVCEMPHDARIGGIGPWKKRLYDDIKSDKPLVLKVFTPREAVLWESYAPLGQSVVAPPPIPPRKGIPFKKISMNPFEGVVDPPRAKNLNPFLSSEEEEEYSDAMEAKHMTGREVEVDRVIKIKSTSPKGDTAENASLMAELEEGVILPGPYGDVLIRFPNLGIPVRDFLNAKFTGPFNLISWTKQIPDLFPRAAKLFVNTYE